jgi:uncharacterized BrkB/YihY/UPF0761 family membrane protein
MAWLLPSIHVEGWLAAVMVVAASGILNALLWPALWLTLGLTAADFILTAFGPNAATHLCRTDACHDAPDVLVSWLSVLMPALLSVGAFILMYRTMPRARVRWRDIWMGGLVAGLI